MLVYFFCLGSLSNDESGVLKLGLISDFISNNICFMKLGSAILSAYSSRIVMCSIKKRDLPDLF